jgi:colicin import membrane protein
MSAHLSEIIAEQRKGLVDLMKNLRQSQVKAAREAARSSASRIKSLNQRVRALAKSGLRVNEVTHGAAQNLIELQAEIVSSALNDAAAQLERLSYTETARDFARQQGEVMQATRQRIVDDLARAVTALKGAAGEVRDAVVRPVAAKAAGSGTAARRRGKSPARAKSRAKVKAKAKSKARAKTRSVKRKPAAGRRAVRKTSRRAR